MNKMDISVVIPLYNEDESIPELYAWIERVMKEHHFSYEVIFISSVVTMARVQPFIVASNRRRVMW